MPSPLENLVTSGKLRAEPPDENETNGLVRTGLARLKDAANAKLALGPEVWRVLDKCHNTRNLGEYEGLLDVDERLVQDLITATRKVADAHQARLGT